MNFITEITGFYRLIQTRQLSSNAQLLWFHLFCLWNSAGFPDWLQVDMRRMMGMIQTNARSTAERARNELLEAGRIRCSRGKSRQPNSYQFIIFGSPFKAPALVKPPTADQMIHQSAHHLKHHNSLQPGNRDTALPEPAHQTKHQTGHEPLPLYKLKHTKPEIKKEKTAYGQFGQVLLSDKELSMLKADFPDNWEDWIRRVDLGKATKNYVYRNDYAAIHSWKEKDDNEARDQAFAELLAEAELFGT